jgi:hypothetical protein
VTEPSESAGPPRVAGRTEVGSGAPRVWRIAAVAGVASLSLSIAAILAPRGFALSTRQTTQGLVTVTDYALVIAGIAAVVVGISVLAASVGAGVRPALPRRRPTRLRWWMYLLAYLAALVVIATLSEVFDRSSEEDRVGATPEVGVPEQPAEEEFTRLHISSVALVAIAGVLFVGGTIYLLLKDKGNGRRTRARRTSADVLKEEIDVGIGELRTLEDPRAAVIACYARMERALGRAGTLRRASETPFELLERALQEHSVPATSAHRLTTLFEVAKFSLHPIGEHERSEAIDALEDVRARLATAG